MADNNEQQNINIATMQTDIRYIKDNIKKLCDNQEKFVTKTELEPIKRLYTKISDISIGFFIVLGGAAIYAFNWIKGNAF